MLYEAAELSPPLWDTPLLPTAALAVTALVYVRGFRKIRRTRPALFPDWRLWCFLLGLVSLLLALASPLDTMDDLLLFMHMSQHLVFMSVAPPLLLLGAPTVPLLRGLPRWAVREILGPLLRSRAIHLLVKVLRRPAAGWLAMNIAYLGWHVPAAYERAVRSEAWHDLEHACFFFTSLLFWWTVLLPWPSRPNQSRWLVLPYLLTADLVNTGLSAFLCFSGRVIYESYAAVPRLYGINAFDDQIAAGALMWVLGSMAFLLPAFLITLQLLSRKGVANNVILQEREAPGSIQA